MANILGAAGGDAAASHDQPSASAVSSWRAASVYLGDSLDETDPDDDNSSLQQNNPEQQQGGANLNRPVKEWGMAEVCGKYFCSLSV
jgi:hypothetical protein